MEPKKVRHKTKGTLGKIIKRAETKNYWLIRWNNTESLSLIHENDIEEIPSKENELPRASEIVDIYPNSKNYYISDKHKMGHPVYTSTLKELENLIALWNKAPELEKENKRLREVLANMIVSATFSGWHLKDVNTYHHKHLKAAETALKQS